MTATPDQITCIYCKQVRAPSREHLLPRALGGNLVVPFVCPACNTGFSRIDQALAEQSMVALDRIGFTSGGTPVDGVLGGNAFWQDKGSGLWNDLRIRGGLIPELLPQIHLVEGGLAANTSSPEDRERLLKFITKRVAAGTLVELHVRVGPEEHCTVPRIVMHRERDAFVRARSAEEGRAFLARLAGKWLQIEPLLRGAGGASGYSGPPSVKLHLSMTPDDSNRAVAKIAFSYLAHVHGAEFALRAEFDSIRAYINGDVVHEPARSADEVLVDHRFVRALEYGQPMLPTKTHAIMLVPGDGRLFATVTLYAKSGFTVLLGDLPMDGSFNQPLDAAWDAYEFSTDRTWHAKIDIQGMLQRMSHRLPVSE